MTRVPAAEPSTPPRWRPGSGPRLLVMGASLIQGVSAERRHNVGRSLASLVDAEAFLDLSVIGMLTHEMVEQLPEAVAFGADVAVVELGGADCLVHPPAVVQRFVDAHFPPRWGGDEGLQPRAVYDVESWQLRARQRCEYVAKALFKFAVVRLCGGRVRVALADVERESRLVVEGLVETGATVLLLRRTRVSWFSSPGTNRSMARLNTIIDAFGEEYPVAVIDPDDVLDYWSDFLADKVHYDVSGHVRIATLMAETIRATQVEAAETAGG